MKPLREVAQAYMAASEGDKKLREGSFMEALDCYNRAMAISHTIPGEEAFDHTGFDALCHTGISGAFVGLERHGEALQSAEIALHYFNRRGELQKDEGKQWISAVLNHAIALHGSYRPQEAVKAFRMAAEMIAERKGEMSDREEMLRLIEEHLGGLNSVVPDKKPAGYKAWWEFWS
jgi:hypothetical protein